MGSYRGRAMGSRTERARSVAGVRTLTAGCPQWGDRGDTPEAATQRSPLRRRTRSPIYPHRLHLGDGWGGKMEPGINRAPLFLAGAHGEPTSNRNVAEPHRIEAIAK